MIKNYSQTEIDAFKQKNNINPVQFDQYELHSVNAASLEPTIQPWLWQDYIPLETCTLIAGTGGIGKSQFLTWLASIVSNGAKFTINGLNYQIECGQVIIISAEDHLNHTVIPRLIAANAKRENIEIVTSAVDTKTKLKERFIALDTDIALLEKKIEELNKKDLKVKFISIDPITAYLGNVKENKAGDVRNFILRLKNIAEKYKLAILLNTHTRKSNGSGEGTTSAADEIMGSIAWSNTVRQAFCITRHHDDDDLIVCSVSKTNYKRPESIAYRIKEYQVNSAMGSITTSLIEWHCGKVDMSANEAMNKKVYEERKDTDLAQQFILDTLKFGSKTYDEIKKLAIESDININTLKYARQKLAIKKINIIVEPSQLDRRKMIWYIGSDQ